MSGKTIPVVEGRMQPCPEMCSIVSQPPATGKPEPDFPIADNRTKPSSRDGLVFTRQTEELPNRQQFHKPASSPKPLMRSPELCPALLRRSANIDIGVILTFLILHA